VAGNSGADHTRWVIHGERLIDESPHIRVSLADVELPDGSTFTQYVFRLRRCVIVLVLDEPGSHVLLTWRHRFIVGKWVWELPGGYVDDGEDGAAAAVREAEEETGRRPHEARFVLSYQPMIGNADFPQDLYLARGADLVREPAADETASDSACAHARASSLAACPCASMTEHSANRVGKPAPGSFVVISHLTSDLAPGPVTAGVAAYHKLVPTSLIPRSHAQVSALFGGLPLVPPGVVPVTEWRPALGGPASQNADIYAGVARTAIRRRRAAN
jgi:ADP-ribose pyrophosphatase YjhB (NUDIX family)